jgi:hypothetical protein
MGPFISMILKEKKAIFLKAVVISKKPMAKREKAPGRLNGM